MIITSFSVSYGNLTVSVDLLKLDLPCGAPNSKLKQSKTYTGFLLTKSYNISLKDSKLIDNFSKTIFLSNLTNDLLDKNFNYF